MRRAARLLLAFACATAPGAAWASPHAGFLTAVALDQDGTSAVTEDQLGGLRLWPTLDGKAEPVAFHVAGVRSFSLRRDRDAWRFGAVGASGGRVLALSRRGRLTAIAVTPPGEPVVALQLTADGYVALFADHSLRVFDRDGAEEARFVRRGFRPDRLALSGDGKHAALLDPVGQRFLRLRLPDLRPEGDLTFLPPASTEEAQFGPMTFVLSPDGETVAAGRVLVHGDGTSEIMGKPWSRVLGFVSPRRVVAFLGSGATLIDLDDAAREATPFVLPQAGEAGTVGIAMAGDTIVGTTETSLGVVKGDASIRYLGWDVGDPARLTSSNRHGVVHANGDGEVVLELADGRYAWTITEARCLCYSGFLDEDRVGIVTTTGTLVIEAETGDVLERRRAKFGAHPHPVGCFTQFPATSCEP